MTALLIGFAIGLLAATVVVGYRIRRARALRDLEEEIPGWVNHAQPKVIYIQDLIDALNFDLWEDEMGERA